jgi:hypothetical protein
VQQHDLARNCNSQNRARVFSAHGRAEVAMSGATGLRQTGARVGLSQSSALVFPRQRL